MSETRACPRGIPVSELTIVPSILNLGPAASLRSVGAPWAQRGAEGCSRVSPSTRTANRTNGVNLNIVTRFQ